MGRRDTNKAVVGKGRRHCQCSSSSRESPVFVGAAEICDGTGLGCSSGYGEGGHREPCRYPRPHALRRRTRDGGDAVLGSHARRRPPGPVPVPAPRQRALNRALAHRTMETGRRG
jgi:hypothetical protein